MSIPSWLSSRLIYLTKHGSHAYGTNISTSDLDLRGVTIPPKPYFLGLSKFEQHEAKSTSNLFYADNHQQAPEEPLTEVVIYELRKFLMLAANGNPNITEILFTDPIDHVILTSIGEQLLAARDIFLSKKMRYTFSGYATAQLK